MRKLLLIISLITCLLTACNLSPAHTHEYSASITKEATCTEPGEREYRCSCGDSYTEGIPATGHTWNEGVETKAPTCTEPGTKTYTCTVCSATKGEEISATGHTWNEGVETKAPTCTEPGTKTYTCTVCSATKEEEISATGHSWDNGTSTTATCTEPGVTTFTCTKCSEQKTENSAALGHNFIGIECSRCGEYSVTISSTATDYTDDAKTDGLKLTLNSLTHSNTNGYNRYTINYTLENIVAGSIGEPGIFKIIWMDEDGNYDSEFQTGTFGYLYYPNKLSRSYSWTLAGNAQFVCIEYIPSSLMMDYIFSTEPTNELLNWIVE